MFSSFSLPTPTMAHSEEQISGEEALPTTNPSLSTNKKISNKVKLLPLIFLIYFEVAGGPYGEEPVVQAAGPLLGILGFLIFPFVWSIPEALITAELSTTYPGNGGYVIWATRAFGPFWGSLMGTWKFLSLVINMAAFPALGIDYLKNLFPIFSSGSPRLIAVIVATLVLSFVNYLGLAIVGYAAIGLGLVSLAPFIVMSLVAIPKIRPRRWISLGQKGVKKDWPLFFNTLFWNLNYFDNVSTLAGEVDKPQKAFPLGLLCAVIFTCLSYIIPLVAVTGAITVDQSLWEAGFMAQASEMIVGKWLKIWIEIGAVLSTMGLFEAQLSSSAYQIEGMADMGFLPKFFSKRAKWFNTPWVAIVFSTAIIVAVSRMNYQDIIAAANFLYSLGMLLEYASFLWLRRKFPTCKRPFQVPGPLPALVVLCLIPSGFLLFLMCIGTKLVYLISGLLTLGAIILYFLMKLCAVKKWMKFNDGVAEIE